MMIEPVRNFVAAIAILFTAEIVMAQTPEDLQRSTTVNELSGKFLSSRLRHDGIGNAMVSSVSLFYALSILERGAAGASAELLKSLLISRPGQEVHIVAPELAEILQASGGDYQGQGWFSLANSVWSSNGMTNNKPFVFSEQFQKDAKSYYGASVHSIDFMAPEAAIAVNAWAEDATQGLIPEVIDRVTLKDLEWVIMNAAYFEGSWGTRMQRIGNDHKYLFRHLDGTRKQAETIVTQDYKSGVLDREDGAVAFALPFMGGRYSLIVHVSPENAPDTKDWLLNQSVQDMPQVIAQVLENTSGIYDLKVQLPVFTFSDEVTMLANSGIADDLGLTLLYSNNADFTPMIDSEKSLPPDKATRIGLIKQDTKIELDEKGVKAAAVSLIGGMIKATSIAPPLPRREIIVDRPFAFAIVENRSQTMLFNGILVRPQ